MTRFDAMITTDKPINTTRRIDLKSTAMIGLCQARICDRLEVSSLTDLVIRAETSLSRTCSSYAKKDNFSGAALRAQLTGFLYGIQYSTSS